jgi:hypothetical protein
MLVWDSDALIYAGTTRNSFKSSPFIRLATNAQGG